MQQIKKHEELEVLKPELGTKPRIYYKNLHLMTECFVGGSVVTQADGIEECAEGAEVILSQEGNEVTRATTDTFGEFKIDKLEPNSGEYELEVTDSSGSLSMKFDLGSDSVYLGTILLI